jgi:hypothetical protein
MAHWNSLDQRNHRSANHLGEVHHGPREYVPSTRPLPAHSVRHLETITETSFDHLG